MLGIIVTFMVVLATVYSFVTGREITAVTESIISSGDNAINLSLTLIGSMAIWGGILKIAEDSGLTDKLSGAIIPFLKKIFIGLKEDSKALKAIAMNVTANIFGLGNAATPLGIEAMKCLEEEEKPGEKASRNMIMLSVFNTSSMQIIPTTVIALRMAYGSSSPSKIIPCVVIVSIISLMVCMASVYAFDNFKK